MTLNPQPSTIILRESWAEIVLAGRRALRALVDLEDVPKVEGYRWCLHPRGVFDKRKGVLLTHVLYPHARRVFFRNRNRLDCRKANLSLRTKYPPRKDAAGVSFLVDRCAFLAYRKIRGIQVSAYFQANKYPSMADARAAAIAKRAEFLMMTEKDLMEWKARHSPVTEHELWLGDDVVPKIAARVSDVAAAARKGYEAGLLASRMMKMGEI